MVAEVFRRLDMSGHSHWATIRHKKNAQDARKGKIFSKMARLIEVAAREGGGDVDHNPRLREIIEKAKSYEMPKDNIERAVKKGTGQLEGARYETVIYEGYGPGGVAILVEALTDNRNRTSNEIRKLFERNNGSLGAAGSVSYMFKRKGIIKIDKSGADEQKLLDEVIEYDVEDITSVDGGFEITCPADKYHPLKAFLEKKYKITAAELSLVPDNYVTTDEETSKKVLSLLNAIEDHDDAQNAYTNCYFPDSVIAEQAS